MASSTSLSPSLLASPSSVELATVQPAPRRPCGASSASQLTSSHQRKLLPPFRSRPPLLSCCRPCRPGTITRQSREPSSFWLASTSRWPPLTADRRAQSPLRLHPLLCPVVALSLVVLPPFGKMLPPLGGQGPPLGRPLPPTPLHLHPLLCPAAALSLGVLPPLGKTSPLKGRPLLQRPRVTPPANVQEIRPGMAQLVTVGALPFLHLHAPSHDTPTFFPCIRPHLDSPISPVLIGDFNCVQGPLDYAPGRHARAHCPTLSRILQEYSYTDSFRSLHPVARIYSYHLPNVSAAFLDRAYLPPLLESRPRVACYLPTASDHHAHLLRLETAGLATLPSLVSHTPANSLYWKFISSLLADPGFMPAFRNM
jgi:hypothetical protein